MKNDQDYKARCVDCVQMLFNTFRNAAECFYALSLNANLYACRQAGLQAS